MSGISFSNWFYNALYNFGPKLLISVIIFAVGWWLSGVIARFIVAVLRRTRTDNAALGFIESCINVAFKIIVIFVAMGTLGLNVGTLIAALGAAGVAIALALKDSLANIASGILILFFHPIKSDDFIEVDGVSGTVTEIQLFYTYLVSADGKRIALPNSRLTTNKLINYTAEGQRRLDLPLLVGYDSDIETVREIILQIIAMHPLALPIPEPAVYIDGHGASGIEVLVQAWVSSSDYLRLRYDLLEQVKLAFDGLGIHIPYETMNVRLTATSGYDDSIDTHNL